MKRIKLLLISPSLGLGGAEKIMRVLAHSLDPEKFDICLVVVDGETVVPGTIEPHIRLVDLKVKRVRSSIMKIRRLIQEEKPDVVLSTLYYLNLYLSLFRWLFPRNVKFIARESSLASVRKHPFHPWIYKTLYKSFFKNFDLIISQSNAMHKDLHENFGLPQEKLITINNPVDPDRIDALLKEVPEDLSEFDVIAVGRLRAEKGYERLVESFSHLKGKGYRLGIVGDGPERDHIQSLIEQYGLSAEIHLLGKRTNPFPFVKKAKVFALTSHYEGFPNVLLEAGVCGKPAVSFFIPGGTKEILSDGLNGFFVKNNDTSAFAKMIEKAIATDFGHEKIRTLTIKKFGVKKIIKEYEDAILEVIEKK